MDVAVLAFIQHLSQRRDVHLYVVFLDHQTRPDPGHEIVLADDFAIRFAQHAKNIERATTKRYRRTVAHKLTLAQIEAKRTEADFIAVHRVQQPQPANSEQLSS
ncbi:MAG TPA: hypothetical protein VFL51_04635 [Pseudolabrys sp.]|nr:hypothetical protein [Pseudolabrys sp.]